MSSIKCGICLQVIIGGTEHLPFCQRCGFTFHFGTCSGNDSASWKKRGAEGRKKWVCHICNPNKNLSNSNSGVTTTATAQTGASAGTSDSSQKTEQTTAVAVELPEFTDVNSKCDFIMTQVTQVMAKITEVLDELRSVKAEMVTVKEKAAQDANKVKELEIIIEQKSAYIEEVDYKNRALEDYSRVDNLIFHGLPPTNTEEEAANLVIKAAKFADIEISTRDISIAHTLRAARGGPAKLVCRFVHRWQRGVIQSAVNAKKMTTQDLELPGEIHNVVAMDHLSPATSILYAETRNSLAQRNGGAYEYVWMRNRRVFIRRREKEEVIEVRTMAQLNRLRNGQNLHRNPEVARPAQ